MARADGKDDRRGALRKLIMLGGAALAGGVGVPAGRLVLGPALDSSPPTERWFRVARLAEIVHGEPKRVAVTTDATDAWMHYQRESLGAVWLLRDQDEVRALSVSCPHLGCGIERVERGFACACHASIFDASGKHTSGPAPRDMDPIDARVVGDGADRAVEVRFRKYRLGIAAREEA